MGEQTLNATMTVKCALKLFNNMPHLVPITQELLAMAHCARNKYQAYLDKLKRKCKMTTRKKILKKLTGGENKLFFEAQRRLTTAAEAKNLQKVGLAQGMFLRVAVNCKEAEEKKKEVTKLQKLVEKRKSYII
ncbi:hypothetical protein PR048_028650 [Dryococelus australis]|uniref:Uncharacterized protein n=1 Tax=Dryococelus australis TaxID=614101 RepID=A0ABQ9GBU2_9NEOP|nr:hypothetical protein PR048_028650 [Dryococelus australis]